MESMEWGTHRSFTMCKLFIIFTINGLHIFHVKNSVFVLKWTKYSMEISETMDSLI